MHGQIDLQATQYIIGLLENSKTQSEEALDLLPGVYTVIDRSGLILKGNKSLATLMGTDFESLLNMSLSHIFSEKQWQIFKSNIDKMKPSDVGIEFKADVQEANKKSRNYLWYLSPLKINRTDAPKLLSLVGRDVTDLTQATVQNTRMQMELNTAKLVQDMFLPPPSAKFGKSSIVGCSESASECGGDWWHYSLQNNKISLWVGDVTGHGVPAALVVSAVHSVVTTMAEKNLKPSEALQLLNKAVDATASGTRAMTFLVASIDLITKKCSYASAAHEPIVFFPQDKEQFRMRDLQLLQAESSAPLGIEKAAAYKEETIQLKDGDQLFFYTDGIYDICNPLGAVWGLSGFHRSIASLASKFRTPKEFVNGFKQVMEQYRQGTPLNDDATFFVFQL